MKRVLFIGFFCTIAFIMAAQAAFVSGNKNIQTIDNIKKLKNETPIQLKGKIKTYLGDEKYSFSDGTGEIIVEIDDDVWKGIDVTEENVILINGEVDKKLFGNEIDVDTVQVLE